MLTIYRRHLDSCPHRVPPLLLPDLGAGHARRRDHPPRARCDVGSEAFGSSSRWLEYPAIRIASDILSRQSC
ncbi:MAG TPA: hypothetical protein VN380_02205 [Thermoanaerobaculia bacterium]|nr:hypothetical protein [Thermoanaerobaculia bacterium]